MMESTNEDSASFEHFTEDLTDFQDSDLNTLRGHFYSVYVPPDVRQKGIQACKYIYDDKIEAMKMVKKTKKARFKYFEHFHEALNFANVGVVEVPKLPTNGSIKSISMSPQIVGERLSPFKGPKPQDLVKLRKTIETGDVDSFRQAVWENPRYLVSNGDTPSILQEGFRYNALHVAAKAKSGILAEIILSTISNPKFVKLLYGDDLNENVETRIQVLLDLYLNTPDKGLNETPLHFASKFGAADVVEVLVSFPECDKNLKNKYGQTPDMIVCDRCDNKEEVRALKKKITMHLENNYYVPVLRADDNSLPASIGEPFSPGKSAVARRNPLSPRLEIHAFAGPMNKEGAEHFRKVWKTPPRTSTPIKKKSDSSLDSVLSLRYTDPAKGLERLGQKLANQFEVNWKEYWSFLDCFIDITSDEGLFLLEKYLSSKAAAVDFNNISPDTPEDTNKMATTGCQFVDYLCKSLQHCKLTDDEIEKFEPFLCVEQACNVMAHRLACEIYSRTSDENSGLHIILLEGQARQVELLILSYLDDRRFTKVNFSQMHARLGVLTAQQLSCLVGEAVLLEYRDAMNKFLNDYIQAFDCYSSDDEGNYPKEGKPTPNKKQVICLMQHVLSNFNLETERPTHELYEEEVTREAWSRTEECGCVFHFKKTRKGLGLSRNHSSKHSFKGVRSRRFLFSDAIKRNDAGDSSSEEEFFTPPGSPSQLCDSDNEEEFCDVPLLSEVFIEEKSPTKTDFAVFKALKFADCQITPLKYPNIYRWYHNVGLYSDSERQSWPRPKTQSPSTDFSTPPRNLNSKESFTPSSTSWLRITGANSPRASLQKKIYC